MGGGRESTLAPMAGGLHYTLKLATGSFLGPLNAARAGLGGFLGAASKLGNITTGLASAKGLVEDFVGLLRQPVTAAADMEALNTSFRSLLKDGGAARALVADLMKFADVTPFEPGPVAEAGKQLLAFGYGAKDLIPVLKDIGDLSAAMDKPLGEVADTFGRLRAGQFGEAFERLRSFGISQEDLRGAGLEFDKQGSFQGSAEKALEAVRGIIRRKFGGGMADLATTFKGLFSTFSGYWDQLKVKFGEPIMNALKPVLADMTALVQSWGPHAEKFGEAVGQAVTALRNLFQNGDLGAAAGKVLDGLGQVFLGNISTGIGAAVELLGVGLMTAFSSGIALLSDKSFWEGIMQFALGITHAVRAALLDTVATMIDKLPTALQFGADTKGLRDMASSARGSSMTARRKSEEAFDKVDWDGVMEPIKQGVAAGGQIIRDAFAEVRDSVANNKAIQDAVGMYGDAAAQRPSSPLWDLAAPAAPGALEMPRSVSWGEGVASTASVFADLERLLSPTQSTERDVGRQIAEAGVFKRMVDILGKIEGKVGWELAGAF